MNKLDSFNKDKTKCKKCKEYFDNNSTGEHMWHNLCIDCNKKWVQFCGRLIGHSEYKKIWSDFLNEQ